MRGDYLLLSMYMSFSLVLLIKVQFNFSHWKNSDAIEVEISKWVNESVNITRRQYRFCCRSKKYQSEKHDQTR